MVWKKDWEPKATYSSALDDAFRFDDNGRPTKNEEVYGRLNALERYCYQTRIED